jgi:hypothetical protein
MNLLELRNRIRDKAIDNGLTYTEIETLFDVNLLLEQTMPCLMWRYSGETNNFDEVGTEMSLNVYLITTFPDSVRVETDTYQRDYIVTQQNALRTYFYDWLQAMPFESGDDYLEIISTEEIPIAERLGINEFLTVDFRVNISIKRDFCVDPEQIAPTPSQVQVYFNDVLRYTQACNVDLELILKNQDGDLINDATFNGYEIVVTQGGGQVTININGVLWDVIDAGETDNIIVRQSSGSTQVGSKQGQYYRIADSVITLEDALGVTLSTTNVKAEDPATIVAPSARVSNSDDSYDTNVVSGGDLELPDITVSNSDDSYSVNYPSVQDVELPDETINIVDEDGNPLDSITFPVYTDPNIDISTYCPKDVFIKGIFAASESQLQSLTIDADNAGTYTTLTQDGGSGTITFEINSTPATLPFTLSVADVLDVFRTTDTSLGHYKITGTYV